MKNYIKNTTKFAKPHGFTLVELLVVIVIIAVLATIGTVVYQGITKSSRDSARKADITAIMKAYEVKRNQSVTGTYVLLADSDFASGKKPTPPEGGLYFSVIGSDGSGAKACAVLEGNSATACNSPGEKCFCVLSSQGTISASIPIVGDNANLGLGSNTPSSCDINGTLNSGLIGYWRFDENSWTGANGEVRDSSGYSHHGTKINGATITTPSHTQSYPTDISSSFANAGNFDGTGYVNVGKSPNMDVTNDKLSISLWMKPNNPQAWGGPFSKGNPASNFGYEIFFRDSTCPTCLTFAIRTSNGYKETTSGNFVPSQNIWYHVAATYDGTTTKLYKNGNTTPVATNNFTGNILSSSTQDVLLGAHNTGQRFRGQIDDIRVYNRSLDTSEVVALFNDGLGCLP